MKQQEPPTLEEATARLKTIIDVLQDPTETPYVRREDLVVIYEHLMKGQQTCM